MNIWKQIDGYKGTNYSTSFQMSTEIFVLVNQQHVFSVSCQFYTHVIKLHKDVQTLTEYSCTEWCVLGYLYCTAALKCAIQILLCHNTDDLLY